MGNIKPYYERDGITIYNADCLEIMPQLAGPVDAIISDPPYGTNNNTDYTRFSGGHRNSILKRGLGRDYGAPITGDNQPFDPLPFLEYKTVILFGYNHFSDKLPPGSLLVWLKRNDDAFGTFLSDAEIAWLNRGRGIYCYKDLSINAIARERNHPNQKPVSLFRWCMQKAPDAKLILDPFMGSGTTLVAAQAEGRRAIGIEISEEYCRIAVDRLRQPSFFSLPAMQPKEPEAQQLTLTEER